VESLYPIFLKLAHEPVLVVGGGSVAERRVGRLLDANALVTVVSPEAGSRIRDLASEGRLRWEARPFRPHDLDGMRLALVATGDAELAAHVREEGHRRGVLINCAEDEALSDYHVPALVEHAGLKLAISTSGASPGLAAKLREDLEAWLAARRAGDLGELRKKRLEVRNRLRADSQRRRAALLDLAGCAADSEGTEPSTPWTSGWTPGAPAQHPASGRAARPGTVYLVGAGPGDPGLITVRGRALLDSADVVFYDRLVGDEVLATIPASCEKVYVGKEVGCAHRANIAELLVAAARAKRRVVRLKGGDPVLFGRGGEEMLDLWRAGVDFEVVPGVSALCSVPVAAGIPVTFRGVASELVVRAGYRLRSDAPAAEETARSWDRETTFVYFMGVSRLGQIVEDLLAEGCPEALPVAIIEKGTLPGQKVVEGTLNDILSRAQVAGIEPPSLIIAGEVVRFRKPESFLALLDARGWTDEAAAAQVRGVGEDKP
jgi:uroporphyrin-III C-methyltransferase/precorrin-2 dehydrogenase/sirohydrochlorin ferrochelatase